MIRIKPIIYFVLVYLGVLIFFMLNSHLSQDTYYYWQWSHHLALSYYDGPPMVAYLMRCLTTVFGDPEFSLYILNVLAIITTSFLIYRISQLLFKDQKISSLAVMIWLLTPGVIRYFFFETTYNVPMIIFWGAATLSFLYLIKKHRIRYYYLCGIFIGFLLLSKYTGILLCASLFLYALVDKEARFIFKSYHTYLALLVALFIFSPVLIWNAQHDWISFLFQLHHGYVDNQTHPIIFVLNYFKNAFIDYHIAFLLLVYYLIIKIKFICRNKNLFFLALISAFVFLFFFMSAFFANPPSSWNAPFFFSGCILLAYFIKENNLSKIFIVIFFILLGLSSLFLLTANTFQPFYPKQNLGGRSEPPAVKYLISQLPSKTYTNQIIVSDYYPTAALLNYYLPGKPTVYGVLPESNQDYFWWQAYKNTHPSLKKVLYISSPSADPNAKPLDPPHSEFKSCHLLKTVTYTQKRIFTADYVWQFYVYECQLK